MYMRKIFIDSRIDAIAEEYKKTVLKHLHYGTTKHLVNPKKKLQKFKKDFSEGQVKEIIGVDANGKKIYAPIPNVLSSRYQAYIQTVIDHYESDLLTLKPSFFSALNNTLMSSLRNDASLLDKVLKVRNKKDDSFHNLLITCLMYEDIRTYVYPKFLKEIGVKTCAYCNANFAVTDINGKAYYTADHWKPKSKYPFLCISFFNLVPCCFSCNRNKGDGDDEFFGLYEDDKNACLDVLHFELPAQNEADYILTHNRESLSVKLVESRPEYHGICEAMDNKLHITSIYQEHKDVVEESIWKKYAYNGNNIEALKASFAGTKLNLTDENVKRFVLGTYSESKDIHKRPLSRLMQDIHKTI